VEEHGGDQVAKNGCGAECGGAARKVAVPAEILNPIFRGIAGGSLATLFSSAYDELRFVHSFEIR